MLPILIVPLLIVTAPVNVLALESVSVPVPIFVRLPAPLIVPAKVVLVLAEPTVSVEAELLNATVAVPLLASDPKVTPIVPVEKARAAVPAAPVPRVTPPATAPLTLTVSVTPGLTTIVSAAVGWPPVPEPVVIWLQFVFAAITIAESWKARVATAPEESPVACTSSAELAYWLSTNQSVVIRPSARPSRSGATRLPVSSTWAANPPTPSVTCQERLPGAQLSIPSVRTT